MRTLHLLWALLWGCFVIGQNINPNRVQKTVWVSKDTLQLEPFAIPSVYFSVKDSVGREFTKTKYGIDFKTGKFWLHKAKPQKISFQYFKYPSFLTQTYSPFDPKLIVPKTTQEARRFSFKKEYNKSDFFGNLKTDGEITRGITVGNNQGSVFNSGLDLKITGNLSDKLKLRASIKDTNIPLQENGVSQNVNEFDWVFIELLTDQWNVKAGDIDLQNRESYFLNFSKKIKGAKLDVILGDSLQNAQIKASAALVRGRFKTQNIQGEDGNQGPYLLTGNNGNVNVLVMPNSETVYVNGIALKRGEAQDYTIDYTTGQLRFNPTFPIHAHQRIIVDFQFSDQNFNRFVTHDGVRFQNDQLKIATYFYQENDIKSQSIQQNLSADEVAILESAGNDPSLMLTQRITEADFDENRIQYLINDEGNLVQSSDISQTLYNATFSLVGQGNGDYVLKETVASGNIYEYRSPVDGLRQGNYAPVGQLFAPTQTQMAVVQADYRVGEKASLSSEIAYSHNDQNLFSTLDDQNNQGWAATFNWQQSSQKRWKQSNLLQADFVHQNFQNLEGLYRSEFNRDWNLDPQILPQNLGNQTYIRNDFALEKNPQNKFSLQSAYLILQDNFKGLKNGIQTFNTYKNLQFQTQTSFLTSASNLEKGNFVRQQSKAAYRYKNMWTHALLDYEYSVNKNITTQQLDSVKSQKLVAATWEVGQGDSSQVYTKFSYGFAKIDSVNQLRLSRVQNSQNIHLESRLLKTKKSEMLAFVNYRWIDNVFRENNQILNARWLYNQSLLKNKLRFNTLYETSAGSTFRQNFAYIETEPGQGFYTYLGDLNENGIRDFDEFEVAQFSDQAQFLRILLPNTIRVATQKAKWNQSFFMNFSSWSQSDSSWKRFWSHFSTQTQILIDKDQLKNGSLLKINPFSRQENDVIAKQQNINNQLFFNRGLQKFSTDYVYQNSQSTQNTVNDLQNYQLQKHEIHFQHNIKTSWLFKNNISLSEKYNSSTHFESRNFKILAQKIAPSITFLKNQFSKIESSYQYKKEQNRIGIERLESHSFGLNYHYLQPKTKTSVLSHINWIENNFEGTSNSPAAFNMLEGLQPGRNFTWSLLLSKNLSKLLNMSLSYHGRTSENSQTIHIGSVQLRASF